MITLIKIRWLLLSKFLHDSSLGHDLRLGAFLLLQDPLQVLVKAGVMNDGNDCDNDDMDDNHDIWLGAFFLLQDPLQVRIDL